MSARLLDMFTRGRVLKVLVVSAALIALILVALYLVRSKSVLYSSGASADPVGEPGFSIFNPFRDRGPERTANAFLEALKLGECVRVMAALPIDQQYAQYLCGKETEHHLKSWQLINRHDEPGKVKMFYWHWRADAAYHDRLWVIVEKHTGQWEVVNYECTY